MDGRATAERILRLSEVPALRDDPEVLAGLTEAADLDIACARLSDRLLEDPRQEHLHAALMGLTAWEIRQSSNNQATESGPLAQVANQATRTLERGSEQYVALVRLLAEVVEPALVDRTVRMLVKTLERHPGTPVTNNPLGFVQAVQREQSR